MADTTPFKEGQRVICGPPYTGEHGTVVGKNPAMVLVRLDRTGDTGRLHPRNVRIL